MEYYASYKNTTPSEILTILIEKDLVDLVIDSYEIYHIERIENAFMDLDSLIETGKVAY
jgi:hypothetical protein